MSRFAQLKQLKTIAKYLPCEDFKLEPAIYEMVLFDFLKTDTDGELPIQVPYGTRGFEFRIGRS